MMVTHHKSMKGANHGMPCFCMQSLSRIIHSIKFIKKSVYALFVPFLSEYLTHLFKEAVVIKGPFSLRISLPISNFHRVLEGLACGGGPRLGVELSFPLLFIESFGPIFVINYEKTINMIRMIFKRPYPYNPYNLADNPIL